MQGLSNSRLWRGSYDFARHVSSFNLHIYRSWLPIVEAWGCSQAPNFHTATQLLNIFTSNSVYHGISFISVSVSESLILWSTYSLDWQKINRYTLNRKQNFLDHFTVNPRICNNRRPCSYLTSNISDVDISWKELERPLQGTCRSYNQWGKDWFCCSCWGYPW